MGLGLLGSASLRLFLKQQERQLARLVQFLDEASGAWVQLRGLGKHCRADRTKWRGGLVFPSQPCLRYPANFHRDPEYLSSSINQRLPCAETRKNHEADAANAPSAILV